ncbi:CYTH domain-containing protein [Agromyces sp. H66]|uniref:CYTH domain-containing protein n=1 Tax=Agromyces sp. H66 TaxID=2529859 RepID=UPI00145BCB22|nr:CYTH domain-containing protein [Agromyces sp. H66]
MSEEFERKYLVASDEWRAKVVRSEAIGQGYLAINDRATIRVRIADGRGTLTVKSQHMIGIARVEVEAAISLADAEALLEHLSSGTVLKRRHYLSSEAADSLTWTVDEFEGGNSGLLMLEVEGPGEFDLPDLPGWVGDEVTFDPRFKNSYLSAHPFAGWGTKHPTPDGAAR